MLSTLVDQQVKKQGMGLLQQIFPEGSPCSLKCWQQLKQMGDRFPALMMNK